MTDQIGEAVESGQNPGEAIRTKMCLPGKRQTLKGQGADMMKHQAAGMLRKLQAVGTLKSQIGVTGQTQKGEVPRALTSLRQMVPGLTGRVQNTRQMRTFVELQAALAARTPIWKEEEIVMLMTHGSTSWTRKNQSEGAARSQMRMRF